MFELIINSLECPQRDGISNDLHWGVNVGTIPWIGRKTCILRDYLGFSSSIMVFFVWWNEVYGVGLE